MFYCDPCKLKKGWPTALATSYGNCEVCGMVGECNNVPTHALPKKKTQHNPLAYDEDYWLPARTCHTHECNEPAMSALSFCKEHAPAIKKKPPGWTALEVLAGAGMAVVEAVHEADLHTHQWINCWSPQCDKKVAEPKTFCPDHETEPSPAEKPTPNDDLDTAIAQAVEDDLLTLFCDDDPIPKPPKEKTWHCEELKKTSSKKLTAGLHLAESILAHLKRMEKDSTPFGGHVSSVDDGLCFLLNPKATWNGEVIRIRYVEGGGTWKLTARQGVLYLAQLEQGATQRHHKVLPNFEPVTV